MEKKKSKFRRVIQVIGIIVGTIFVLLYLVLPAGMGVITVIPGSAPVGSPPQGFETVVLRAEDGVQLQGWYHPPANGAVIILLHGAGGTRESMRPYADMLVKYGFGVLALDLRGHGVSEGRTNRLGWQGTLDVGAAVHFLQGRNEVRHIAGFGSSMGGEVLLGAASAYPQIQAIAADGATRRCLEEYLALETNRSLVRNFTTRVMYATVQLLTGDQAPKPLLQSMTEAEATRFLLIAGGGNALEVSFNRLFKDTLGDRATLWVAPEAEHITAFSHYPQAYEKQIIAFFQTEREVEQ